MKNIKIIIALLFCVLFFNNNLYAQVKGVIQLKVIGITPGETFVFKDINDSTLTFSAPTTKKISLIANGKPYKFTQIDGPRQSKITKPEGTTKGAITFVNIDCTPAIKKIELVSRSSDLKSFGTFYGSATAVVGGINETGVNEGQFVSYMTSANIDPKHGGKYRQIIWFNRGNGKTALVSKGLDGFGANKDSYEPSIDHKGYTVAFESWANNLVEGDVNNTIDVFVWTLMDNEVRCVTCDGNYASQSPAISGNADFIAFQSNANNLTAGVEGNATTNVYLKNLRTGETILLSKDPNTGKGLGGKHPSISEDGSRVAFYSYSDKLVDGDNNRLWDIFVWDRNNPTLKRISLTASGTERNQGNESMSRIVKPAISGDGRFVAFANTAGNMMGDGTAITQQVYVAEIETGIIKRASETASGLQGDKDSPIAQGDRIAISFDGKFVSFPTLSTNLGGNIILKNMVTGEVSAFGTAGNGGVGTVGISKNGNTIVFPSGEKLDKKYNSTGIFAISN